MKVIKVLVPVLLVAMIVGLPLFAVPKPTDIPPLMEKLKSENGKERLAAVKELGGIGLVKAAYVKQAVPAILVAAKDDKDMDVRLAALTALGQVNPDPDAAIPVFTEALKAEDDRLKIAALQGIVYFGPKAKGALSEVDRIDGELRKLDKDEAKKKQGLRKAVQAARNAITGKGK